MPSSRIVLLHGFTQTGRSFEPLTAELGRRFEVVTPDLPGHGTRSEVRAGLWDAARLVGNECGRAVYLGYSMGGRVALHLALDRPDLVERLVLVSATAGIEDHRLRAARREEDEERARVLENEGVPAFLDRWLARPMFAGLPEDMAGREARLENTAEGLASALRLMGTGAQEPLWARLLELTMPVLLVAGERDDRFSDLAVQMGGWIGAAASLALVPDAGHSCHLERPRAFVDLVLPFLGAHDDGTADHDHGPDDHGPDSHSHTPDHP